MSQNHSQKASSPTLFGVYAKIVFAPLLVFFIFLLGFFGVINLKVEAHSILMMGILLFIALILAFHNGEFGRKKFEIRSGEFEHGLEKFISSNYLKIADEERANAKFEDFVDEFSTTLRNQNYASVAAGIFPMLGILGTFISIAISMPQFSSSDINSLEKEIAQLLGGVGTAFYVSIYGIFLALWWIYFEKKGISRFARRVSRYKEKTKGYFWNKDSITQTYLKEISYKNSIIINSFKEMIKSDFSESLNLAIKHKFTNLQEILNYENENLNLNLQKIKLLNENLYLAQNNIANNFGEFTDEIHKFNSSLVKFADKISQNQSENNEILKSELKSFLVDFKEIITAKTDGGSAKIIDELRKTLVDIDHELNADENR